VTAKNNLPSPNSIDNKTPNSDRSDSKIPSRVIENLSQNEFVDGDSFQDEGLIEIRKSPVTAVTPSLIDDKTGDSKEKLPVTAVTKKENIFFFIITLYIYIYSYITYSIYYDNIYKYKKIK